MAALVSHPGTLRRASCRSQVLLPALMPWLLASPWGGVEGRPSVLRSVSEFALPLSSIPMSHSCRDGMHKYVFFFFFEYGFKDFFLFRTASKTSLSTLAEKNLETEYARVAFP